MPPSSACGTASSGRHRRRTALLLAIPLLSSCSWFRETRSYVDYEDLEKIIGIPCGQIEVRVKVGDKVYPVRTPTTTDSTLVANITYDVPHGRAVQVSLCSAGDCSIGLPMKLLDDMGNVLSIRASSTPVGDHMRVEDFWHGKPIYYRSTSEEIEIGFPGP